MTLTDEEIARQRDEVAKRFPSVDDAVRAYRKSQNKVPKAQNQMHYEIAESGIGPTDLAKLLGTKTSAAQTQINLARYGVKNRPLEAVGRTATTAKTECAPSEVSYYPAG